MGKKILIDATHPEETRVAVLKGNKVEDFDYESATHKQIRGNIYLAKVTRVEPSLQAAFVDYGGNRHGFLAFSEIHPDYYQIPLADRQALLEEEEEEEGRDGPGEEDDLSLGSAADVPEDPGNGDTEASDDEDDDVEAAVGSDDESAEAREVEDTPDDDAVGNGPSNMALAAKVDDDRLASDEVEAETIAGDEREEDTDGNAAEASASHTDDADEDEAVEDGGDKDNGDGDKVESVGAEDAMEEVPQRRRKRGRNYKIQEVIKRRQIILVQVVKEERGNKGAALTTYLSMAGRYCVLMPNTSRGGGISRKITDSQDRKRLKEVAGNLDIPQGMGLIVRTAGANRTKAEIRRDCDYLMRLWESVRDLTLQSHAPCLVYEEGSLIKRSIRDQYGKDVDSIVVEGEAAYREAKDLMKMLMPSHAKNVKPHKDSRPLFSSNKIETQLDALYSPQVTLPSGGYIVINQTEALVAIDVNSGKSTREYNIESTALKTNLEASDEVARQMRLRDLAGLIVIDFIDMEERRNNRAVERRLKEALKNDRARIQVGRISHFGLLEMSRQRMRTGVLEGSTLVCHHCEGQGFIRSTESCALSVLRGTEEHLMGRKSPGNITVHCDSSTAAYILNQKRDHLHALESTFKVVIFVEPSGEYQGADCKIEKAEETVRQPASHAAVSLITAYEEDDEDAISDVDEEAGATDEGDEERPRRKRRRRGRRGGRGRGREEIDDETSRETSGHETGDDASDDEEGGRKRGRRRRSRSGRTAKDRQEPEQSTEEVSGAGEQPDVPMTGLEDPWDTTPLKQEGSAAEPAQASAEETMAGDVAAEDSPQETDDTTPEADAEAMESASKPKTKAKRKPRARKKAAGRKSEDVDQGEIAAETSDTSESAAGTKSKKRATRKKKAAAKARSSKGTTALDGNSEPESVAEQPDSEVTRESRSIPAVAEEPAQSAPSSTPESDRPKRQGWWQRK